MSRCSPVAHLLGYESSILGQNISFNVWCYWEHVGIYTLRTCGKHVGNITRNFVGTHMEHDGNTKSKNIKISFGKQAFVPQRRKDRPS
jgi:hypothetical protein